MGSVGSTGRPYAGRDVLLWARMVGPVVDGDQFSVVALDEPRVAQILIVVSRVVSIADDELGSLAEGRELAKLLRGPSRTEPAASLGRVGDTA